VASLNVEKKVVVGVTGMPGSGKSTAVKAGEALGYPVVVMGDLLRAEVRRRGLELTDENIGKVMFQWRAERGEDVLAKFTIQVIRKLDSQVVLIDGIRTSREVEEFRKSFPGFTLIAVHAPVKLRFKRIFKRSRIDDVQTWEMFRQRDLRELRVGVGAAIAMSDVVVNDVGSLGKLKSEMKRILRELSK